VQVEELGKFKPMWDALEHGEQVQARLGTDRPASERTGPPRNGQARLWTCGRVGVRAALRAARGRREGAGAAGDAGRGRPPPPSY
jgi:hypothetical protein